MIEPDLCDALVALDLPPAVAAERMAGYDATVWRVELPNRRTVAVRILRPGVSSARELAAMRLAAEHGHPVPDIVAVAHRDGRDVVASSWCDGRTIGDLLLADGDPVDLGRLLGNAHAQLHAPLAADGSVLCHLDFQPFNVLAADGRVTGIVDWANARVGDRCEDLAWTRVVLAFGSALIPQFADGIDDFTAAWQAGYAQLRTMPGDAELAPFLADAAHRQLGDWQPRAAAGECPPAVLDCAEALTRRWPQ
jgi:Ser/Thr protein kinase RdoA (MazF antagonist)